MPKAPACTCPRCGRSIRWDEEFPERPFCSARCRLLDLGAWLQEENRIAGEAAADAKHEDSGEC